MAVEVKLKRWGNSMAVIVPSILVEQKNMKENDKILIEIVKKADLSDVFGMIKKRKMSGQEAKDMAREGWD
ncbi:hypothetical protein HYW75_00165 [Candidatus Pacearchaeota archaeon]|nr:hypothetical protein [Candidatus Pacearchaeota archaeon]